MNKLSDRLFKKYCDLVYHEAGINLTEEKRELLNARIGKLLRIQNITPENYYKMIQKDRNELNSFIDAVTTNHTYFFRESKSFSYLDRNRPEIWCAASSSGEEPYSLAMSCMDKGFIPSITATDISISCLEAGRRGIYSKKIISGIPKFMLRKYFQKGRAKWEGHVKVKNNIRGMVNFQRFNLIKDSPKSKTYDIIFCRNVMIYFDNVTKEQVISKLSSVLKKGGFFIIGGAESLSGLNHPLKYVEPSVYLKK